MKKYFYDASSWIWRNKGKSIFLGLFIFGATHIFIDFLRLPWKIDFWIYWDRYQNVIRIFEENPNISTISYEKIAWINWKKWCSNPSLKYEDFPRTTRETFWISEPCNVTYNYIFDAVKKADVAYFMRVSENDKSIRILTNSLYSRILDTSYIYSKWFFKNPDNLWRNYLQILNEDWWVYQDLN